MASAMRIYASGIRNCVGEAIQPETGDLWCSTNERDGLGDNLPPDYITHVQEGGFYGWPWYYMGDHQDPRHRGQASGAEGQSDRAGRAAAAAQCFAGNVVLRRHAISPAEYHGNIFASEHGSWNKQIRTGYEVIRVPVDHGKATGEYEDFLTGFRHAGWAGLGPARGNCCGQRWFAAGERRRFEHRLARQLRGRFRQAIAHTPDLREMWRGFAPPPFCAT